MSSLSRSTLAWMLGAAHAVSAAGCSGEGSAPAAPEPVAPTVPLSSGWGAVVDVEFGGLCTFYRHSSNLLSVSGINEYSNAGISAKAGGRLWTPTLADPLPGLILLSPGYAHTLAWTESGLLGWGSNAFGQLGLSDFGAVVVPTPIPLSLPVSDVHAAGDSSIAILSDGSVWMWGRDVDDNLRPTPYVVPELPAMARILFSEWFFSCGLDTSAQAWCWGDRSELQPWVHEDLPTDRDVWRVAEWDHARTLALHLGDTLVTMDDGRLLARGDNAWYQLGTGDNEPREQYVAASVPEAVLNAGLGFSHACALGVSGTVYCWGSNHVGQVGDPGAGKLVKLPTPVVGVSEVVDLAVASDGACAVERDGDVYCWGYLISPTLTTDVAKVEFPTVLGTLSGEAP